MTDRPHAGGSTETAAGPAPGYYPDPSVPGFVRYWGGSAWVPGTSRPAPAEGEVLEPPRYATRRPGAAVGAGRYVPPPVADEPAGEPAGRPSSGGDTGPVYLDQTGGGASFTFAVPENGPVFRRGGERASGVEPAGRVFRRDPEPEPGREPVPGPEPVGGRADHREWHGPRDSGDASRWVSWGVLPEAVEDPPAEAPAAPERAGGSEAAGPRPVPVPSPVLSPMPSPVPSPVQAAPPAPSPVSAPDPLPDPLADPLPAVAAVRDAEPAPSVQPAPFVPAAPVVPSAVRPAAARPAAVRSPAPAPAPAPRRRVRAAGAAPAALPAGLGRRVAARLVDTAVLAVVAVAAGAPLGRSVEAHLQRKLDQARMASRLTHRQIDVWLVDGTVLGKAAVLLGILLFVGLLYEVLPTARTGQTFGKRLARIRVVAVARTAAATAPDRPGIGRSLLRWLVRQLSTLLVAGLFWPLFDRPARRGWHDRAARTRVVRL
ncbi:RDD family protein [Kitasatospora sp. NPDC001527]|uniref:RDD family protein n=1 Tax=Kitasatospora sp. NPDC001527 TaxID=3154519 RepID=UPI00333159BD